MAKKKKVGNNNFQENENFNNDIKKAEEILFYKKREIIKYFNKKVPFVVFPYKYMKKEDISFTITDFGKIFVHFYTTEEQKTIIFKNGVPVHYDPPGLITIGPGLEYEHTFIKKIEDVLKGYLEILEKIKEKYPEKTIYFGRENREYIENISFLEKTFCSKIKIR